MTVRVLGPGDLEVAADVLASAFFADPMLTALFPEAGGRARASRPLFRAILAGDIRRGRVSGVGSPLDGVAVWHLPGDPRRSVRGTLEVAIGQARLLPWARALARAWDLQAGIEQLQKAHGAAGRAHLYFLGVRPEAQGRGLGGALVRPVLDVQGPAWAETQNPSNVGLYEHLGFEIAGTREVPSLGLTVFGLRRG
ncbi:MAG: GNAT family N-acetyltransferase [Chloroflexota bacterium]